MEPIDFKPFQKIARYSRDCIITEKIDGTNASICITEDVQFLTGSRNKWITPEKDNYGFSRWANDNKEELMRLGPGTHFGEWWGKGIQRGYNQISKRFSLFNVSKWTDPTLRPNCCDVVPVISQGLFTTDLVEGAVETLRKNGSIVAPGYPFPEGIVIFHVTSGVLFKKTLQDDERPKGIPCQTVMSVVAS